jgi:hypothetical protein
MGLWLSGAFFGYSMHQAYEYFTWNKPMEQCIKARQTACKIGEATLGIVYRKN